MITNNLHLVFEVEVLNSNVVKKPLHTLINLCHDIVTTVTVLIVSRLFHFSIYETILFGALRETYCIPFLLLRRNI